MNIQPYESTIGNTFRNIVKGKNIITSNVYGYIETNKGICEITTGIFMNNIEMWGITVVDNFKRNDNLSKCVNSFKEVEEYISFLNYEDHSNLINLIKNCNNA